MFIAHPATDKRNWGTIEKALKKLRKFEKKATTERS